MASSKHVLVDGKELSPPAATTRMRARPTAKRVSNGPKAECHEDEADSREDEDADASSLGDAGLLVDSQGAWREAHLCFERVLGGGGIPRGDVHGLEQQAQLGGSLKHRGGDRPERWMLWRYQRRR